MLNSCVVKNMPVYVFAPRPHGVFNSVWLWILAGKAYNVCCKTHHYSDVIMGDIAHQITSIAIAYSNVYSGTDQRKHQSSASLAFVRGIHRRPVNSPHKWPVTRKIFPFDDVIMWNATVYRIQAMLLCIVVVKSCSEISEAIMLLY